MNPQNKERFYRSLPLSQIKKYTPNFLHPQIQNQNYISIVSTSSKHLHLMNFQIRPSIQISKHYIWRNPEYTKNKTINIGHLIRHVYIAKLGSNIFSRNLKPGTVWLGPHRSHMVYYTPLGHDTPLGGGCLITMW